MRSPTPEVDERNRLLLREPADVSDEAVVQRSKECRRRDRVVKVVTEEVDQLAGGLQSGQIAVEVDAVDTAGGQGEVIADNAGDVGAVH